MNRHTGRRVVRWVLLEGNRLAVAGTVVVATLCLLVLLVRLGLVAVGPRSSLRTLLSSGITSGLLALVTISLSVNQLVLSRVFGSPEGLADRLDETVAFRDRVATLVGRSSVPTDPAATLALLGTAFADRATVLAGESAAGEAAERGVVAESAAGRADDGRIATEESGGEGVATELTTLAGRLDSYAAHLVSIDATDPDTDRALEVVLGSQDVDLFAECRRIERVRGDRLAGHRATALADAVDLLRTVAVLRQFYKTMTVQQDLARLSRLVAYTGVLALVTAFVLTLTYHASSGATLPVGVLAWVAPLGLAIVTTPLAIFVSYILRVATVSRYTVSVGPFVPPEERFGRADGGPSSPERE